LSLLETILGLSFEEILKQLPLPDPIARALKGEMNEFRALLQLFALCQRGAWDATFSVSEKLGIASDKVAEARMASIKKAEELMAD
jgi:EAL and modified HD-GYP domain-containing signal transduction protein